jgi:glyoxylase-like metal-dependent hydrolase (beta-lactamase superfamily II)
LHRSPARAYPCGVSVTCTIISIGAMDHNLLWDETRPVRTAHATTSLVEAGEKCILVDPSLPANILAAKFHERTGRDLSAVTDVFCTTLHPHGRRALDDPAALAGATWWTHERELEWYARQIEHLADSSDRLGAEQQRDLSAERELVGRFRPAGDSLAEQVSLFPLHGATEGSAGLLLTPPTQTILIAGPAVPTGEHLRRGMIWQAAADHEAAMDCLGDILELADCIVPGFDNLCMNPHRWM